MDDNFVNLPEEELPAQTQPEEAVPAEAPAAQEAAPGGISFGGGVNNAYIRQFAEAPQYGRTLEEIEQAEQNEAGNVNEQTRERYRAQAKRRMAETENGGAGFAMPAEKQQNPGWRVGGKVLLVDPLDDEMPAAAPPQTAQDALIYPEAQQSPPAAPAQPAGYVQPIEEDALPQPGAAEATQQNPPKTGFQRLFSSKKNFAVFTVITGALNILWEFLYFVTLANREIVMSATENTLRSQGQTAYTLIFESPMLGLLKFMMFLLPVFAVIWAVLFKKADSKKYYYNRKTVVFMLCLIALAMIVAAVDLTALHLLG